MAGMRHYCIERAVHTGGSTSTPRGQCFWSVERSWPYFPSSNSRGPAPALVRFLRRTKKEPPSIGGAGGPHTRTHHAEFRAAVHRCRRGGRTSRGSRCRVRSNRHVIARPRDQIPTMPAQKLRWLSMTGRATRPSCRVEDQPPSGVMFIR